MNNNITNNRNTISLKIIIFLIFLGGLLISSYLIFSKNNDGPTSTQIPQTLSSTIAIIKNTNIPAFHYIEITNGCGPYYDTGTCINMRSGPGANYPAVAKLRTGIVLKVEPETVKQEGLSLIHI